MRVTMLKVNTSMYTFLHHIEKILTWYRDSLVAHSTHLVVVG